MSIEKLTEFASSDSATKDITGLTLTSGFPKTVQPARQWFNWLFNSLTAKINEIIDGLGSTSDALQEQFNNEIGLINICPFISIPINHLACEGQTLNIADYPALFAKLGTLYGGDGTTTFMLPDLRGYFVRGWDNERGIDTDREFGSAQDDELKSHKHTTYYGNSVSSQTWPNGYEATDKPGSQSNIDNDNVWPYTSDTGGTETRPKNIAMIFVIKVV